MSGLDRHDDQHVVSRISTTGPFVEEGAAFAELALRSRGDIRSSPGALDVRRVERHAVVVIGGGQSGLSTGYHLSRLGVPFVILDANPRTGDSWRNRWDSLRLFSPARFDGLDGMPFPAAASAFPTKDEMADYLEAYAHRFRLPVRNGVRVERLFREGDRYVVIAGDTRFEAEHVVVAMATYQRVKVPTFASGLDPRIVQVASSEYRRPDQFPAGGVLVVGAGNSGAEIGFELAKQGRAVWLSGRSTGEVPFRVDSLVGQRIIAPILFRGVFHRLLTVDTPIGRRARPNLLSKGGVLIRTKSRDLARVGVERVPRTVGVKDGKPLLADGRVLDPAGVVWCTGYDPAFSWIELPAFDEHGDPRQRRGVVPDEPGLYFVGTHFLYAFSSTMIHGVGRDAQFVANAVANRVERARESPHVGS